MRFTLGRVLIGLFFLAAGVGKIFNLEGTIGWVNYLYGDVLFTGGATAAVIAAIAIEIVAGAALIANKFVTESSFVLVIFTVLATLGFHQFWNAGESFQTELLMFQKNIIIVVALLLLARVEEYRLNEK